MTPSRISPERRWVIAAAIVLMIYALPRTLRRELWNRTAGRFFRPRVEMQLPAAKPEAPVTVRAESSEKGD